MGGLAPLGVLGSAPRDEAQVTTELPREGIEDVWRVHVPRGPVGPVGRVWVVHPPPTLPHSWTLLS